MKATVLQENLVKGVNAVSRMATVGGKMPILSHILIRAKKQGLYLLATDLSLSVSLQLGAKVEDEGEIAVPAKLFGEYLGSLKPGKVELRVKKETLEVKAEGSRASFQTMAPGDFPDIPVKIVKPMLSYDSGLERDVAVVSFAAANDESRPVLTGVQWKKEGKKLRMVATDGYRLSIKYALVKFVKQDKKEKDLKLIVPAKALMELAQIVKLFKYKEKVQVGLDSVGNQLIFEVGDLVLVSRQIEGDFPPFENIVPEEGETKVEIEHEDLLTGIRMASIFARESANIVKWEIKNKQVVVSANNPQVGENESVIDAKVSGDGGKIAFNSRYLIDFLNAVESSLEMGFEGKVKKQSKRMVLFEMSGALKPGLFKISGDDSLIHVIMPVRVQEK